MTATETSFTYNAWWSGDDTSVLVRLEGHDAADKIAYVIRTQKTFWEIDQLEYIAMVGPSGGIYLDVGSNIGNHAVFFGRFCADHVVAIEPNPRLHPILTRNIDANVLKERTTVVPVGISDTDVVGAMALRDEHDGNIGASHIIPGPAAAAVAGERVTLRRLDDLIAELASSLPSLPITFLKIDVEGMEMGVLRSATTVLREHRPQIFIELITEDALDRATSLLREFGYTSVDRLGTPPSYHFIVPGRHALRDNKWHGGSHHSHSVHMVEEQLAAVTSPDAVVIVADLEEGGFGRSIAGRARLPFVEKQGQYFGPPADDAHAIGELTRLCAAGATHFALLWPAFWFFDTYPLFEQHLRRVHRCVLENARAIVFRTRIEAGVPCRFFSDTRAARPFKHSSRPMPSHVLRAVCSRSRRDHATREPQRLYRQCCARLARSLLSSCGPSAVGDAVTGGAVRTIGANRDCVMHPRTAGKFIETAGERFLIKGACYGTFAPSDGNGHFPRLEQVRADFALMAQSGFNTVRTYTAPSLALLDEAARYGLRVMIGLPWSQHVAFLDNARLTRDIRREVTAHVRTLGSHPAALLFAIGNEIPPSVVRWHGHRRVTRFLEDLCADARSASPHSLLSYVNYPPTEYLELDCFDVCAFNVYLHREADLRAYLARLQHIAGPRPLLLAEAGADSIREGTHGQAAITAMLVRAAFEEGLCGAVAFSWTDEWWRGGSQIDDWAFGLVDAARRPKPALAAVSAAFASAPFPEARTQTWPRVSVVICAYNAGDTLDDCLDSLGRLRYPDFEVIVVNDGSRDATGDIARRYPVRLIEVPNGGLSAARNIGLSAATGEIVAYTDADVRVDPDWLTYLVQPFLTSDVVGSGGPNVVPSDDPFVAQCVARAPGGPTHVLLDDRIAEHVPGCNMAFRREALLAIDGFNPVYLRAGDDVDICWRLQAKKQRIGFSPSALVWHHHRPSIKAYWRQQVGYGEGEAWLEAHHPEKFVHSTMLWHGRIYSPLPFVRSLSQHHINSGVWGTAPFPSVYSTSVHPAQLLPHLPAWQGLSTLALVAGAGAFTSGYIELSVVLLLAGVLGWITTIARCLMFGWRSDLGGVATVHGVSSRVSHRLLIAWLHFLQPLARGAGRIRGRWAPPPVIEPARTTRLAWRAPSPGPSDALASARLLVGGATEARFWSETWTSPDALLTELTGLLRAARPTRVVEVDDGFRADRDVSIGVGMWGWLDVRSLIEEHGGAKCLLRVGLRLRPARVGVVLALSLLLALLLARTAIPVKQPWVSAACVLCVALVVTRAARQTSAAVTLARRAVQRAAITAGMMPILQRGGSSAPWRLRPRVAMVPRAAQALVLALLAAGSMDTATSLLRGASLVSLTSSISAVEALIRTAAGPTGTTPAAPVAVAKAPGIAGDVEVAPNGDLIFADTRRGVIHRFDVAALSDPVRARSLVSDSDERQVLLSDGRIDSPTSVSIGPDGELYAADAGHNRVTRIKDSGDMVVLAGTGIRGFDGDLKPAFNASLNTPNGVAVASNGNVYIADSGNNRIRMVSAATGVIRTVAGTGESGPSDAGDAAIGDGGPAKLARLSMPMDVAIGPDGDIYVADMGHHRVRVIDSVTGIITTIAGDGRPRSTGDGGPARRASLAGPIGLALSWSKREVTVFVAEYLGGSVRAITRGGDISSVGSPGRFSAPSRLAYRQGGWLYVVDDKGAVTVVNVSRGRPIQVAGVITRGQSQEVVSLAGRAIE